jgi:hypothetical protein
MVVSSVGGVAVNRIAKWNGSWSALGTGTNGTVYSLANNNGVLLAGGEFSSAGGLGTNRIARWNGSTWSALSSGMSGGTPVQVLAIAVFNSVPYAGGDFNNAGGITVNNIARWGNTVGVKTINNEIPESFMLKQNYPNPFNPSTNIEFSIAKEGFVKLTVYNSLGQVIYDIINGEMKAGNYKVTFDAGSLSTGVYYYELFNGNFRETKKMILAK